MAATLGAAAIALASVTSATAVDIRSGRIVDSSTGDSIAGIEISVFELDTSGGTAEPGALSGSGLSGADGTFAFEVVAGPDVEEFFLFVDGGASYQGGWFNGTDTLGATPSDAGTIARAGDLGDIELIPVGGSAVSGRVVDATTGRPVPLVLVVAFEEDYTTRVGWAVTNLGGEFSIDGLDEEFALRFIGVLTWRETGWLACAGDVVPTPGESCTTSPGDKGDIPLDRR